MGWKHTWTEFTAADAEAITGVAQQVQRDWRRYGHIPANDRARARFDARELARLMVLRRLGARGIAPKSARGIAEWASVAIYARLEDVPGAVADPDNAKPAWERIVKTSPRRPVRGRLDFPHERYLVVRYEDDVLWTDDRSEALGEGDLDAIIFDLNAYASQLVTAAGRPLVTVEDDV